MELVLIAAVSENNVIGYKGGIPWNIPEDRAHFRDLTIGHPVIMGRATYESLPRKLEGQLPNRTNIIITSKDIQVPHGVFKVKSLAGAISAAMGHLVQRDSHKRAYVIGGEQVYEDAMLLADKLEITRIKGDYLGDRVFPRIKSELWELKHQEKHEKYSFETYARR